MTATNFQWSPTPLQVEVGDAVTFTNGGGSHTWVSDSGMGSCELPCTKTFSAAGAFDYHCGIHSTMRGRVTVGPVPVIVVAAPSAGASVSLSLDASGSATIVGDAIVAVKLRIDSRAEEDAALAPIADGVAWSGTLDVSRMANGNHVFVARAITVAGASAERRVDIVIANPGSRDLAIASISSTPPSTSAPRIIVRVANDGTLDSGAAFILLEYRYQDAWRRISETLSPSVPGASNVTLNLGWSDGRVHIGEYDVRVTLDSRGNVVETDETNNVGTTTAAWYTDLVPGIEP